MSSESTSLSNALPLKFHRNPRTQNYIVFGRNLALSKKKCDGRHDSTPLHSRSCGISVSIKATFFVGLKGLPCRVDSSAVAVAVVNRWIRAVENGTTILLDIYNCSFAGAYEIEGVFIVKSSVRWSIWLNFWLLMLACRVDRLENQVIDGVETSLGHAVPVHPSIVLSRVRVVIE